MTPGRNACVPLLPATPFKKRRRFVLYAACKRGALCHPALLGNRTKYAIRNTPFLMPPDSAATVPDAENAAAPDDDAPTVDLIASSAARCGLVAGDVDITETARAEAGYCVAVRVLENKVRYNEVEDADGTFRTLRRPQVIVGALGERQALKGYSGGVPDRLAIGDELHVLNKGGIIGRCTSAHPDLGPPLRVGVLGGVRAPGTGDLACLQTGALPPMDSLTASAPLVMVSGSSMDTGKTMAACALIEQLAAEGRRVAAAKLTGAALQRDVRRMASDGAVATATFTDAGVVASTACDMRAPAKGIITHLNEDAPDGGGPPDVIVIELGDGFIGPYGVDGLLRDPQLRHFTQAHVVTASDLAGAWAADHFFSERFDAPITAFTGPVTDNAVGRDYIEDALGRPALNALQQPEELVELVSDALDQPPPATLFSKGFGEET
jgi:hypothetical protein